jgi:hypothetical protein
MRKGERYIDRETLRDRERKRVTEIEGQSDTPDYPGQQSL